MQLKSCNEINLRKGWTVTLIQRNVEHRDRPQRRAIGLFKDALSGQCPEELFGVFVI